ncbi:hypothetical protein [Burkholderia pseudomallei]|uniref:hypothetical protein n=1 Tax=Burkholderia pseudomallei TaxID=28450 RepID=UPI0005DB27DA|nr:hypothetical protein [Burkholderia pseudomallei]MCE2031926.1 hypothetical protein [Burkholderia pseudomallei CS]MCE2038174.1 hypothetical protein [Burkholderia pseudomallei CB]MCE2044059.1 hypothetical protein [Burkholderia pseudomallei OS]MCE2050184.1 hypothetical protein [Burkholderia pseudomallei OB]OAG64091.1 hypothetical protein BIM11_4638 [Burkholderia pseudomallei]
MKNKKRPTDKSQSSANKHRDDSKKRRQPGQFELLPPPAFAPVWPASNTLPAEALSRLLTGERLTQPAFGTSRWRLAAYVMELKYLGWPVKSAPVHYPGRARPIAQYWLDTQTILAARSLREAD